MPVYEYRCPKCELRFEKMRPISCADQGAPCTQCDSEALRVPSTFAAFAKTGTISAPVAGGGGSCSGCAASSCSTCH